MSKSHRSQVRIIAGEWRGRKLYFPAIPQLRPSPDSVRETLFNWLSPVIVGASCLDLFAGSGALSFEALSRGATYATMVESSPVVIKYLKEQLERFEVENAKLLKAVVPSRNLVFTEKFDIVFLDPPFHKGFISKCCEWLEQQGCLKPEAYIYIEAESKLDPLPVPLHWKIIRSKKAGEVGYHLLQRGMSE